MDRQEEINLKVKISKMNASLIKQSTKHENLSHRLDSVEEELNEIWEILGQKRKDTKQNEK